MNTFIVHPDPDTCSDHIKVRVFKTVPAMRRYAQDLWAGIPGARGEVGDFRAICIFYQGDPKQPCFGEALFHRGSLKAELIAHEMLHCAIRFDMITKDPKGSYRKTMDRVEERLCSYLGTLVREMHEQIQRHGIHLV